MNFKIDRIVENVRKYLEVILMDEIEAELDYFLENQTYEVKCKKCSNDLEFGIEIDRHRDMYITVEKCDCE